LRAPSKEAESEGQAVRKSGLLEKGERVRTLARDPKPRSFVSEKSPRNDRGRRGITGKERGIHYSLYQVWKVDLGGTRTAPRGGAGKMEGGGGVPARHQATRKRSPNGDQIQIEGSRREETYTISRRGDLITKMTASELDEGIPRATGTEH